MLTFFRSILLYQESITFNSDVTVEWSSRYANWFLGSKFFAVKSSNSWSRVIFSNKELKERKSVCNYLNRPDLEMGVTRAVFHMLGKTPFLSNSLEIIFRGLQISSAASFSIFAGILSGPGDLESFSSLSAVSIYCLMTDLNLNWKDPTLLGINRVGSSFNLPFILLASKGPTLVKCLLKAEQFLFCLLPASFEIKPWQLKWFWMFYHIPYLWLDTAAITGIRDEMARAENCAA